MDLIISITLFSICISSFFINKKYLFSMIICMWIWYLVQFVAITPLDPKYIIILYGICFVPSIIVSIRSNNRFYGYFSAFFKFLMLLICFIFIVMSSLVMSYYHVYGQFGETQLLGVLQTNVNESLEGLKIFVGLRFFVYFILFCTLINIPGILSRFSRIKCSNLNNLKLSVRFAMSLLSVVYVAYVCLHQDFDQKNMMVRLVKSYFKTYKRSFEIVEQRKSIQVPDYVLRSVAENKTIILVVGESVTRNHMGAYGYFRDTTPWLNQQVEEGKALLFENAFSSHALTALTVPLILSESGQKHFDDIPTLPSVINILSKFNFNTYWFSNQGQLQGALYLFPLLNESKFKYFSTVQYLNRSKKYDFELIDHIRKNVDFSKSNFVVVHLMGSHFHYKYRYPKDFTPNLQDIEIGFYGIHKPDKIDKIDSYDKSIAYTDYFLESLSKTFKDDDNVAIVYVSDHGESVVGNFQHDYSKEMNTDIFSIPFFVWTSNGFINNFKSDLNILMKYVGNYFTNDRTNDIIKYLSGIDVKLSDVFYSSYEDVYILHGKKKLQDITTGVIKDNVERIRSHFDSLCISGKTNTLKKIMIAEESGFDGVEIDLMYDELSENLLVADQHKNSGLALNIYLNQMKNWNYKRLLLRINNISHDNYARVLAILNNLNVNYNIIDKTLLLLPLDKTMSSMGNWNLLRNFDIYNKGDDKNCIYLLNREEIDIDFNKFISGGKFVYFLDDLNIIKKTNMMMGSNTFDFVVYKVVTDGEL
ncbi:Phosphoethanolamine transferase for glucans (OPG), alkaline phosphatase superfamily [Desulfomicrobium apsheronum]|uniref:Phosphoethanolamine transferase for glucans (OPG), alkaline phosphatase superfamily n=1 Tax=Desulfomicrobium apsheronum TaxID=52560 RepID=A0A1I3Z6J0_9BACT|nr:phosphoethanolamine transferase [Desulfomicrobium apsheronum]SFK39159.1 Phosphoethanolamine transferase for glucans (OPG), alkaline phosphatase superfamily [Desulfomicrobium apsheronum]